ncbi:hypothetical protein Rhe02_15970 [Rhizocola hellebori]|uniref:Pyrrolo-quinoline quinone repeat domain-containing protein n=1 Tax=Rhizocola hellebori TaxID=1392758 RepID=A0A8J3Q5E3_9ACTN|nr:PQQ-binding-like beta-propeller repeat protein [Rhizocola hellebori]GIH03530.1 hypothetical protein Rhe02_15970 [Rhizocola hellebori]
MVTTLIDLDNFGPQAEAPASAPQRLTPFTKRLAAAGVALLCLLMLGAGGGDPQPAITRVAQVPITVTTELRPAGDLLMIVDTGSVIAFDQETARPRWSLSAGLVRPAIQIQGGLLTVVGYAESQRGSLSTVVLDPATGAEKWRAPTSLMVLGDLAIGQSRFGFDGGSTGETTVYDLDGHVIWSRLGLAPQQFFARERRSVITLDPAQGKVTEYDLSTGAIKRELTDPLLVGAEGVFASREVGFFRRDEPVLEWRGSAIVEVDNQFAIAEARERYDCVVVWCDGLFGRTDLVDKQTGTSLFTAGPWSAAVGTDFGVLGIAMNTDTGGGGALEFYDTTRRRLVRLPTIWQAIGLQPTGEPMVKRGPLILLAPGPSSTYVAVIDKGGFRVVGSVPDQHMAQCSSEGYAFSCRTQPQTLSVWRVN